MATKSLSKAFNMIMFRGKLTVNPNTLNNEIHTYFFADFWQKMYTQTQFQRQTNLNNYKIKKMISCDYTEDKVKLGESQYSYKKWMELIKSVSQFNRFYVQCYKEAFKQQGQNINIMDFRAFRLFHDWDVWGDSTSYPELKATAVFDASRDDDPIVILDDDLHLSTKMGTNKCILANMDTDSQDMTKLFAFTLNLNQQLKLHLNPSVCRSLYFRTVDALPWTPSMGVHWFGGGNTDLLHGNIDPNLIKWPLNKLYDQAQKQNLTQMRMLQYRYNHPSKVSSVVGFLMNTDGDQEYKFINHNWRVVSVKSLPYNNPSPTRNFNGNTNDRTTAQVFFRNVQYGNNKSGVLVDVSAAVMDANNKEFLPFFPHRFKITISNIDNTKIFCHRDIDNRQQIMELFHKRAGLLLFTDVTIPNQSVKIQIYQIVYSNVATIEDIEVKFNGNESQYNLQFKDHFLKTQPIKTKQNKVNFSDLDGKSKVVQIYNNYVQYTLNCTHYGNSYNGQKTLSLNSKFQIDPSGLTQYTTNADYLKTKFQDKPQCDHTPKCDHTPRSRIEKLIANSQKFRNTFQSYDEVNRLVFQNKLDQIIQLTDSYVDKLFSKDRQTLQYSFSQQNNGAIVRRPFKLSFVPNEEKFETNVVFVNGIAKVKIYLNKDLTEYNNPRHPAMESLCMLGSLQIKQNPKQNVQSSPNFTALYFQNPLKNPYEKIDWLNVVGPKLKLMGLLYPSMQNIVNLYQYDGLSMNAMRRAFEIQDQNHSRYMPATRQMSPSTHRQIRRWLYNPIYDSKIPNANLSPSKKNLKPIPFKTFDQGKAQLVTLLKEAFKLELTTIPLYLSAMYSISTQGEATKLIRSVAKDEMKHLFIVSNILNALGEAPPFPQPNEKQNENLPTFPILTQTELICFRFQLQQNHKWKELMNPLPIQSSIREQLLRFIMIQMPGEAYEIQLTPILVDAQNKCEFPLNLSNCACGKQFCNCSKTNMYERAYRINLINDAIDAVVKEMAAKNIQTPKGSGEFMTIGMAYEKISDYLWALNDMDSKKLFSGDNARQFTYMYLDTMCNVIDLRTALEQIRLITEQGEGSSMFTVTGETNKSSHFINFIQIFTGCDLEILSEYSTVGTLQEKSYKRSARFVFTPNNQRFPNFPNYTNVYWTKQVDVSVDQKVNSQLTLQRLSDNLRFTQFPNTFAPRSFLNNYVKILEELGFIFTTDPKTFKSIHGLTFDAARLKSLQNAVARMRQMTLNATHIIHPNDTFDRKFPTIPSKDRPRYPISQNSPPERYPSASPKYNIQDSQWIPQQDSPLKPEKSGKK